MNKQDRNKLIYDFARVLYPIVKNSKVIIEIIQGFLEVNRHHLSQARIYRIVEEQGGWRKIRGRR